MPSAREQNAVQIRKAETVPWQFFDRGVLDVTELGADPYDTAWEAVVDGEVAGMVAVEEFTTPFLVRLAVRDEYRRQGVATALVKHAKSERDSWYAYVDEGNDACQALLAGLGFQKGGYAPPPNLERWSWQRDGDA